MNVSCGRRHAQKPNRHDNMLDPSARRGGRQRTRTVCPRRIPTDTLGLARRSVVRFRGGSAVDLRVAGLLPGAYAHQHEAPRLGHSRGCLTSRPSCKRSYARSCRSRCRASSRVYVRVRTTGRSPRPWGRGWALPFESQGKSYSAEASPDGGVPGARCRCRSPGSVLCRRTASEPPSGASRYRAAIRMILGYVAHTIT